MARLCAIYGASRGIGRAIATKFHADGYDVAVLSRNIDQLQNTSSEITKQNESPSKIHAFQCDIRNTKQINESVTAIKTFFKRPGVDVLINCAGVLHMKLLVSSRDEVIEEQIGTNLLGTIHVCRAHLKGMLKEKSGAIICIGSSAAAIGWPGQSVYAATKAALSGFARNLAAEVASRQITVNVVAPGLTATEMTSDVVDDRKRRVPLGRLAEAEEVADLVKFVAECRYMTGQTIYLDGGLTSVLPQ